MKKLLLSLTIIFITCSNCSWEELENKYIDAIDSEFKEDFEKINRYLKTSELAKKFKNPKFIQANATQICLEVKFAIKEIITIITLYIHTINQTHKSLIDGLTNNSINTSKDILILLEKPIKKLINDIEEYSKKNYKRFKIGADFIEKITLLTANTERVFNCLKSVESVELDSKTKNEIINEIKKIALDDEVAQKINTLFNSTSFSTSFDLIFNTIEEILKDKNGAQALVDDKIAEYESPLKTMLVFQVLAFIIDIDLFLDL